jgi:hypothetical protein
MPLNSSAAVQRRIEHANAEVEDRERPDASDAEAHAPHGAVVRLLACREHDQENGHGEWPAKR